MPVQKIKKSTSVQKLDELLTRYRPDIAYPPIPGEGDITVKLYAFNGVKTTTYRGKGKTLVEAVNDAFAKQGEVW